MQVYLFYLAYINMPKIELEVKGKYETVFMSG